MPLLKLKKAPPDWYMAGSPISEPGLRSIPTSMIAAEERAWNWRRCLAPMCDFRDKLGEGLEAYIQSELNDDFDDDWARCQAVVAWMKREGAEQGLSRSPLILSINLTSREVNFHDGLHRIGVAHHLFGAAAFPALVGVFEEKDLFASNEP
jgi:hypothetical protein